jgi:2-hydroxy-6-oxonona-2,4-dienedioate hydrolase
VIRIETTVVDGRRVRYRELSPKRRDTENQGPRPMLLIHGLAGASDNWVPFLCHLDAGAARRVVVPDLPGYGHSAGPPHALDIVELAKWLDRLMTALDLTEADVAAHSMGCQAALALAHHHPERVGHLAVIGPTTGKQHGSLGQVLLALFRDSPREPFRYKPLALRMFLQIGLPRYLATVRRMWQDDAFLHAACVEAPCLVLRGARDPVVPEGVARRLAGQLPNGSYAQVEGGWHVAHFSRPAATARLVLSFMEGAPTAPVATRGRP